MKNTFKLTLVDRNFCVFFQKLMKTQKKIGNYIIEKTLGAGATGKVKLARSIQTEQHVAIKIIKKSIFKNQPSLHQKILREIALMRLIDHPSILGLIEVIESENRIYLVEQYASKGSLFDVIQSLSVPQAFNYFRQIIYGLEYLHMHGICHRDLKPENILLDEDLYPKLTDFGLSKIISNEKNNSGTLGTAKYIAPEIWIDSHYSTKSDVYAYSIILYEIITGEIPFKNLNNFFKIGLEVSINNLRPSFHLSIPNHYQKLIKS